MNGVFKVVDKKWDCIRVEEGVINKFTTLKSRG